MRRNLTLRLCFCAGVDMSKYQDKERAKAVILEIIRQAGGKLHNKTNLFKAFYHAHLEYAKANRGYLSTWPIVRMPKGPGIDWCDRLLGELTSDGSLKIRQVKRGNRYAFLFSLSGKRPAENTLPEGSAEAIKRALARIDGKTADEVSGESHRRAWESARNGEEMNIYLDLTESDSELQEKAESTAAMLNDIWPN